MGLGASNIWFSKGKIVQSTPVTPAAGTAVVFEGLWVGVGGDVELKFLHDSSFRVLKNVADGEMIIGAIKEVGDVNTTATDIIGVRIEG